ncbi:MAG: GNAT family N-acetyltransferase [Planctomycetales bacterium]|nr:GNAT family N-acetyltransferase [Planctomycetales bacterium]
MNDQEFSPWTLREASAADIEQLVAFNCAIAKETENKQLDRAVVARGVSRGLERGPEVVYYVAEDDRSLLGMLMLTREWSDWRDGWLVWIQSVFVTPEARGRGVFRSLLRHVLSVLRESPDVLGVRLYVERDNTRAQAVYHRCGFDDPRYQVLEQLFNDR